MSVDEVAMNTLVCEATVHRPSECRVCPKWVVTCAHYDSAWVVLHEVKGDQLEWYVCRGYGPAPHVEHPTNSGGANVIHACLTYPEAVKLFLAEEAVLLGREVGAL